VGENGFARLMMEVHWAHKAGQISDHDRLIAEKIAYVMTGGAVRSATPLAEEQFHALEREVFVDLCRTEKTRERIQHMLQTGKPLRN
jgi:3-hydroxyacyl-CoA dehydrogenase